MRHSMQRWGGLAIVFAAAGLSACGSLTAAGGAGPSQPSRTAPAAGASARPYLLYTHCGIDEARIGGRYFEAVHPLSDGNGNPPAGWGNPDQHGTMTLLSPARALFSDKLGHHVLFRLRPGAMSFKHVCS